jgi:hypothetical protein
VNLKFGIAKTWHTAVTNTAPVLQFNSIFSADTEDSSVVLPHVISSTQCGRSKQATIIYLTGDESAQITAKFSISSNQKPTLLFTNRNLNAVVLSTRSVAVQGNADTHNSSLNNIKLVANKHRNDSERKCSKQTEGARKVKEYRPVFHGTAPAFHLNRF